MSLTMETIAAQDVFETQDVEPSPDNIKDFLLNFSELSDLTKRQLATRSARRMNIPREEWSWQPAGFSDKWSSKKMAAIREMSCNQMCKAYIQTFRNHPCPEARAFAGTFLLDLLFMSAPTISEAMKRQFMAAFEDLEQREQDPNVIRMVLLHWKALERLENQASPKSPSMSTQASCN